MPLHQHAGGGVQYRLIGRCRLANRADLRGKAPAHERPSGFERQHITAGTDPVDGPEAPEAIPLEPVPGRVPDVVPKEPELLVEQHGQTE